MIIGKLPAFAIPFQQLPAYALDPYQQLPANVLDAGIVPDPKALAAMWLDFTTGDYWSGGIPYTLTAMPGYVYTRTGSQGAVNSAGAVAFFAPNVPAINDRGFHAYKALTNTLDQSNSFNLTYQQSTTTTANDAAAPDGTMTADKIIPDTSLSPNHATGFGAPPGPVQITRSVFAKAAGYTGLVLQELIDGAAWRHASFNLAAGELVQISAGVQCWIYPMANGWFRCVAIMTGGSSQWGSPAFFGGIYPKPNGATDFYAHSFAGNGVSGIHGWGNQCLAGAWPDGGPVLATAGAAAGIGAGYLGFNTPNIPESDFIVETRVDLPPLGLDSDILFLYSSTTGLQGRVWIYRFGNGASALYGDGNSYAVGSGHPVPVEGGPASFIARRRAGKWTLAIRYNGVSSLGPDAVFPFAGTANRLWVGGSSGSLNGQVRFAAVKRGTYTDTDLTARLAQMDSQ